MNEERNTIFRLIRNLATGASPAFYFLTINCYQQPKGQIQYLQIQKNGKLFKDLTSVRPNPTIVVLVFCIFVAVYFCNA